LIFYGFMHKLLPEIYFVYMGFVWALHNASDVYDPLQPHWFAKTEYEGVIHVPL
jgi:hypothetical protein